MGGGTPRVQRSQEHKRRGCLVRTVICSLRARYGRIPTERHPLHTRWVELANGNTRHRHDVSVKHLSFNESTKKVDNNKMAGGLK